VFDPHSFQKLKLQRSRRIVVFRFQPFACGIDRVTGVYVADDKSWVEAGRINDVQDSVVRGHSLLGKKLPRGKVRVIYIGDTTDGQYGCGVNAEWRFPLSIEHAIAQRCGKGTLRRLQEDGVIEGLIGIPARIACQSITDTALLGFKGGTPAKDYLYSDQVDESFC